MKMQIHKHRYNLRNHDCAGFHLKAHEMPVAAVEATKLAFTGKYWTVVYVNTEVTSETKAFLALEKTIARKKFRGYKALDTAVCNALEAYGEALDERAN